MRAFILTGFVFLLVGCGFQLRGQIELPEALQKIAIQNDMQSEKFRSVLMVNLVQNGVKITSSSSTVLKVSGYKQTRLTRKNSAGKTSSVDLQMRVNVALNEKLPETLRVMRSIDYTEEALLSQAEEERTMVAQMQQTLARQVLQRLKGMTHAN